MNGLPNFAHRRAVMLMIIAPALWSIAGVVTRHLSPEITGERALRITFWRSLFAAVFVWRLPVTATRLYRARCGAPAWPDLCQVACGDHVRHLQLALTLTSTATR